MESAKPPKLTPLKLKAQLLCGDEIAFGPGKADLLDAISAHGSISAAARAMGMSYRRAWLLVDAMNRCWQEPLVETSPGSPTAGARITPAGQATLARYRALQAALDAISAGEDSAALQQGLRATPLPSGR